MSWKEVILSKCPWHGIFHLSSCIGLPDQSILIAKNFFFFSLKEPHLEGNSLGFKGIMESSPSFSNIILTQFAICCTCLVSLSSALGEFNRFVWKVMVFLQQKVRWFVTCFKWLLQNNCEEENYDAEKRKGTIFHVLASTFWKGWWKRDGLER